MLTLVGCNHRTREKDLFFNLEKDLGTRLVSPDEFDTLVVRHEFEFTNPTQDVWNLAFSGASCGCTHPKIEDPIVEPGTKARVVVEIRASGKSGDVHEYVQLTTGATKVGKVHLGLKAELLPRISLDLGRQKVIKLAKGGDATISGEALGRFWVDENEDELIVSHSKCDGCTVKTGQVEKRTVKGKYHVLKIPITVHIQDKNRLEKSEKQLLRMTAVLGEGISTDESIEWRVDRQVNIQPQSLFFSLRNTNEQEKSVKLTADEPFKIVGVSSSTDWVTARLTKEEVAKQHQLQIRVVDTPEYGDAQIVEEQIEVETTLSDAKILRIPVRILFVPVK